MAERQQNISLQLKRMLTKELNKNTGGEMWFGKQLLDLSEGGGQYR